MHDLVGGICSGPAWLIIMSTGSSWRAKAPGGAWPGVACLRCR